MPNPPLPPRRVIPSRLPALSRNGLLWGPLPPTSALVKSSSVAGVAAYPAAEFTSSKTVPKPNAPPPPVVPNRSPLASISRPIYGTMPVAFEKSTRVFSVAGMSCSRSCFQIVRPRLGHGRAMPPPAAADWRRESTEPPTARRLTSVSRPWMACANAGRTRRLSGRRSANERRWLIPLRDWRGSRISDAMRLPCSVSSSPHGHTARPAPPLAFAALIPWPAPPVHNQPAPVACAS